MPDAPLTAAGCRALAALFRELAAEAEARGQWRLAEDRLALAGQWERMADRL